MANATTLYGQPRPKFSASKAIKEALYDESPPQKIAKKPSLSELGENDYYYECDATVYVPFPYDAENTSKIAIFYSIEIDKKMWGIEGASVEIKKSESNVYFTLVDGEKEISKTLVVDPSKLKIEQIGDGIIPTRVGEVRLTLNEDGSINYGKSTIEVLY